MRLDVTELMSFYDTPLGRCARKAILDRINGLWGSMAGLDVLGIGYGPPYLEGLEGEPRRAISIMPPAQGGHGWQWRGKGSTVAIAEDGHLPFQDRLFDRILIIHSLEEVANISSFFREVWRVAAPEAKIIVVTPNRAGVWSLRDATPFGYGRPFSHRQLKRLLRDSLFEPTAWTRTLYTPPVNSKIFTSSSEGWERFGEIFVANLGGVNLVEGTKRVQIDPNLPEKARVVVPRPGRVQLS